MVPRRILMVKAERNFLEVMQSLLVEEGYQVEIIDNDATTMQSYIRINHPDLIILDIPLEHSDSSVRVLDLLAPVTRKVPVILCADPRLLDLHADTLHATGVTLLVKPFNLDTLLATIHSVLNTPRNH